MRRPTAMALGLLWLVLLLLTDGLLVFRRENLRHQVDALLFASFGRKVTYGSFAGGFPGDLVLKEVLIQDPRADTQPLARIPELRISVNWTGMLFGQRPLDQIVLKKPLIRLAWNQQGALEVPGLFASGKGAHLKLADLPAIRLKGLGLHLLRAPYLLKEDASFDLATLDVVLRADLLAEGRYGFSATLDDPALGRMKARGFLDDERFRVTLEREGLFFAPALTRRLSPGLSQFVSRIRAGGGAVIQGRFDLDLVHKKSAFRLDLEFEGTRLGFADWGPKIENLRGAISYEKGRFETQALRGEFEGGALRLEGHADLGGGEPALVVDGEIVGLPLNDAFVAKLGSLPPPADVVKKQLESFRVRGPVDLAFTISSKPGGIRDVNLDLDVDIDDCSFMFQGPRHEDPRERGGFHYPLKHLEGRIHFTRQGLRFRELGGRDGGVTVRASGQAYYEHSGEESYDVGIGILDLPIDQKLLAALSPSMASTIRELGLLGTLDVWVHPLRHKGEPDPDLPELRIDLKSVDLRPKDFPYLIGNLTGALVTKGSLATLKDLRGLHSGGVIQIGGRLRLGGDRIYSVLHAAAQRIAFDQDLVHALEVAVPDLQPLLKAVDVSGHFFVHDLEIIHRSDGSGALVHGDALLAGVRLLHKESGLSLVFQSGGLHFDNAGAALLPDTRVSLAVIPLAATGHLKRKGGFVCVLKGHGLALKDRFLDLLKPFVKPDLLPRGLQGRGDLTVEVRGRMGQSGVKGFARLDLKDASLKPAGWADARIQHLDGRLTLDLKKKILSLDHVSAQIPIPKTLTSVMGGPSLTGPFPAEGGTSFSLSINQGVLRPGKSGLDMALSSVQVFGAPLDVWTLGLFSLSRRPAPAWHLPPLSGRVMLSLPSVLLRRGLWNVPEARVSVEDLLLGKEGSFTASRVVLNNVNLVAGPRILKVTAVLEATALRILGVPIPELEANVDGNREGLLLNHLRGVLFGRNGKGRPQGSINGEISSVEFFYNPERFNLNLLLEHLDLRAALEAFGSDPGELRGEARVQGVLGGLLGDTASFEGSGDVKGEARHLLERPFFLKILSAVALLNPGSFLSSAGRTKVRANWSIKERRIAFSKVRLRSSTIDMNGRGLISFDGMLNASFGVTHKGPLPLISNILALIPGFFLGGVQMSGPIENPRITTSGLTGRRPSKRLESGRRAVTKPIKH